MSKVRLTAGRVSDFTCPAGRSQAFLWDLTTPGLALRATDRGSKSYVFQGRFSGQTLRITIGAPATWSIPQAQERARELQRQIDEGRDPRAVKNEAMLADAATRSEAKRNEVTVSEAWEKYLADRKPVWGDRHYVDHLSAARVGGKKATRGTAGRGVTVAGPLHGLMTMKLGELSPEVIEAWAVREAKVRPTQARLALRLLKAFVNWCNEDSTLKGTVKAGATGGRRVREVLGNAKPKADVLLREQLPAWFRAVLAVGNPVHATYLQALLLCGCRPGELLDLTWDDIGWTWHSLTIRDKVEGDRTIPLTPYVESLLASLPRVPRCKWVFASARLAVSKGGAAPNWVVTSASGRIAHPTSIATKVAAAAGVQGLTLHGLRRSFRSLSEWLEVPVGVVAQIMGHKPSATAEKHYTVRPLDLLRVHHERIEAWILEQAGIPLPAKKRSGSPANLAAVGSA